MYHHSTKLYQKISLSYCHLYCSVCTAQVTMPTLINKRDFFLRYSTIYGDNDLSYKASNSLHIQAQCTWLVVPDMDSHVTCSKKNTAFINCMKLQGFPIHSHELDAWKTIFIIQTFDFIASSDTVHVTHTDYRVTQVLIQILARCVVQIRL